MSDIWETFDFDDKKVNLINFQEDYNSISFEFTVNNEHHSYHRHYEAPEEFIDDYEAYSNDDQLLNISHKLLNNIAEYRRKN